MVWKLLKAKSCGCCDTRLDLSRWMIATIKVSLIDLGFDFDSDTKP